MTENPKVNSILNKLFILLKWYLFAWILGVLSLVIGFCIPESLQKSWDNIYTIILWFFIWPPFFGGLVLVVVYSILLIFRKFLGPDKDSIRYNISVFFVTIIVLVIFGLLGFYFDKYLIINLLNSLKI